ncbi:MAG TPA: hypothetical protein VKX45_01950 [Bryobacteraceae bacterium]|jgi:hypothetical protein|nr:hypothetical protein [Bryobacteraceae bacterium]
MKLPAKRRRALLATPILRSSLAVLYRPAPLSESRKGVARSFAELAAAAVQEMRIHLECPRHFGDRGTRQAHGVHSGTVPADSPESGRFIFFLTAIRGGYILIPRFSLNRFKGPESRYAATTFPKSACQRERSRSTLL